MPVNISQRMPDDLHERVKAFAADNGLSINVLINQACEYFLSSGGFASFERRLSALEMQVGANSFHTGFQS